MKKSLLVKNLCVVLTLSLLATAFCGCGKKKAMYSDSENWVRISEDGTKLLISLPGNATTGYQWTVTSSDDSLIKISHDEYVTDTFDMDKNLLMGAGGVWEYELTASKKASGSVKIECKYARPWETDTDPIEYKGVDLKISNGKISIVDEFIS